MSENHFGGNMQKYSLTYTKKVLSSDKIKNAFTLAEVLITLGIIGVVASLTLPGLIQNNSKTTVEAKLKKFYTNINQAIMLSEAKYGDRNYWYTDSGTVEKDSEGNPVPGSSTAEKWFNKYIGEHMKVVERKYADSGLPIFYFADGTALEMRGRSIIDGSSSGMRDWMFYTTTPEKCLKLYGSDKNSWGKCAFAFIFAPTAGTAYNQGRNTFEPYKFSWNGNEAQLKEWCKNSKPQYCTAVIQLNGWTIPDDYPYKVSY